MRYNCEEIKYFLACDESNPVDETEFLNHLENCSNCRDLVSLQPELEEILAVTIPKASPLSFKKDILPGICKLEREKKKQGRIEKITLPAIVLFTLMPLVLVAWFWKDIRSLPESLNLAGIYSRLAAFVNGIDLPAVDLAKINDYITHTPLLTFTLISVTAIVWAFSIMEAQKALK